MREIQIKPIYECRYDERLKTKVEEFTLLTYTGFLGGLRHLKIESRLRDLFPMNQERDVKTRPIYECRCDTRLKTKVEKSTHLTYTETYVIYYNGEK
jgi:hypothetical protein